MIDFHNHILPDVDDGPHTIEESISMLKHAQNQGITEVINTVHFQHPKMDGRNVDYSYLLKQVDILQKRLNKEKINITIHLSAEVFYLPNLVEISKNPLVTLGSKKYMLIEFKNNIYPFGYENQFYELQLNGITPIVAHPERYRFIQNDINILQLWKDRGYLIQIDGGSILGDFGKITREISLEMIKNGFVNLIGSDSHNIKKRNFCLFDAYEEIESIFNKNIVEILKINVLSVLKGKKVVSIRPDLITINNQSYLTKINTYIKKIFLKFINNEI